MRRLFISDIHGYYDAMIALLKHAKYQPGVDQLVIGGDMIDRGPDSGKVLRWSKKVYEAYPSFVKVLAGNHEDMLRMFLHKENGMWIQHGGAEASKSFTTEFPDQMDLNEHLVWAISLPHILSDGVYVYVHAGIDPTYMLNKQPREECLWMPYTQKGQRFSNMNEKDILAVTKGRKVVHGHTPKKYVFDDGVRICCDLGAGVLPDDPKLALVDLTADHVYQYHLQTGQISERAIARKRGK